MRTSCNNLPSSRGECGASTLIVICTILGANLFLFGLVFALATIMLILDGEDFFTVLVALVFTAIFLASGVLLIALPRKLDEAGDTSGSGSAAAVDSTSTSSSTNADGPEILSRTPLTKAEASTPAAGEQAQIPLAPVPVPVTSSSPDSTGPVSSEEANKAEDAPSGASTAESADAPGSGVTPSNIEELANLVTRSQNVIATLKDLVRHEASAQGSNRHLASMLEATGIMAWDKAPVFEAGRLHRTHHFWMRTNADALSNEDYDRLIAIEAALNVNQDLRGLASTASVDGSHPEVAHTMFSQLSQQSIRPYQLEPSLAAAYPGKELAGMPGEWAVRARIASDAECAVTPFRVVYDMRVNVAEQVAAISLELPRPACMAIFSSDEQARVALARSYALRLATLLAANTIEHSKLADAPLISTVYVSGHERNSHDTLLSVRFDQELVDKLSKLLTSDSSFEDNGFPSNECIRASFGPDGWFQPVKPFVSLNGELLSPAERFVYPEMNRQPASDQLRAITGARIISDLGINENAGRLAAWDKICQSPWSSTEEIVSRLKQELFDAADITVSEACSRTIDALLSGAVDATDRIRLNHIFIAGSPLERAVEKADHALDESEGPDDPERAVALLTEALAPIQSLGAYLDDTDTVYRYFGSISERIRFNLDIDDHRREVRLVPDAYYNALASLSIAYDELGKLDEAMAAADEMCRIAPASAHAALRKVRVLEHQSRVYEAADLIKSVLRFASTTRDAAVCHYRLAFMEWKLGREDLAIACYQRALTWDTEMSQQAQEELNDLLNSDESLHLLTDDEVIALLAKEGIPLGCDESDMRRTLGSAALCTDEGVFWAARPLVGMLFGVKGDDVMLGVYRSLEQSVGA